MIIYSNLRRGIRAALLAVTNPNMPTDSNIAWENRTYKPKADVPWMREKLLPGLERKVASDTLRGTGLMQYDLLWPAGKGTEDADDLADDIKDAFAPNTTVDTHGVVFRAERLPAITDAEWYQIPIRLTWRVNSIG